MRSSRSNLFTNRNFTGGTEIGKGGPLLAAKISPGGPILEGGPKFSLHDNHFRRRLSLVKPQQIKPIFSNHDGHNSISLQREKDPNKLTIHREKAYENRGCPRIDGLL